MKKSARMGELAREMAVALNEPPARQHVQEPKSKTKHKTIKADLINNKSTEAQTSVPQDIQLNPPHGEKDNFERMSITLPPLIRQRLLDESNRRKKERSPDWSISVIVREALAAHLK
jgi:hypothetical protein